VKRSVNILLAAALTGFASLASAQAKIGVVNTEALVQNSPQYVEAQTKLQAEFGPRDQELKGLNQTATALDERLRRDAATMTELQRAQLERELTDAARSFRSKKEAFDEDFELRRQEEMQKLQTFVRNELATFAKANGYDLILVSGVGYHGPTYDVTKSMLEALTKKAGVAPAPAGAAPAAKPPATPATAPKPPAAPAK
jgi:outer membrane protein